MNVTTERSLAHITAEAAEWFTAIRGEELTPAERVRFANWLDESPVHVREYLGVAEAWGVLSVANAWPSTSAEELIAAARAASNVVSLPADNPGAGAVPFRVAAPQVARTRHQYALWFSAVAAVLLIAGMTFIVGPDLWPHEDQYSTRLGEQRSIVLSDGSVVNLNTLSRMAVRIDQERRRIELSEGEAFFRVAHDAARPFEVVTPLATVRAVGTQFNVYSRGRDTQVAVADGRVVVFGTAHAEGAGHSPSIPTPPAGLAAGQQIVVTRDLIGAPKPVNVAVATAWTQRRLAFENERIDRVVEEFNRYNTRRLQVVDPDLSALRISGVFDADDPAALVHYLERVQGVQVEIDGNVSLLIRPERWPVQQLDRNPVSVF